MDHSLVIATEADRFATALTKCAPDARVPSCPDWTAEDLLWHLTTVHLFWAGILHEAALTDDQVTEVRNAAPPRPASMGDMFAMREAATEALVHELDRLPDTMPRWSWWPTGHTVGFTRRMQLAEAVIHRVDAELTAGTPSRRIAPEVAAATADQVIDVMHAWLPADTELQRVGIVRLSAGDTGYHALAELLTWEENGDAVYSVRRVREGEPQATASGTGHALACWLWDRPAEVSFTGDDTVVDAMRTMLGEGIG